MASETLTNPEPDHITPKRVQRLDHETHPGRFHTADEIL
jgi:hypothetical protein